MDTPQGMLDVITINGVPFSKRAEVEYRHDYAQIAADIRANKLQECAAYRTLILKDLWFVLYFIVKPFSSEAERGFVNHPFVVGACREIESGHNDFTLDVWARFHFKSSILTVAETIQAVLRNPEEVTGIFSYARPVAKKFLFTIKEIFQREAILKSCFPEIVWENPEKEAPLWSLDEGIVHQRKTNRKEATISAFGLTEGMPTGLHFNRRIYDDIVTEDIADSVDIMESVKEKFDSSQNLGTFSGTHRVIGTYYHHNDPLTYISGKKDIETGEKKYLLRKKPGSVDGTANGKPVLLSKKQWNDLKLTRTFYPQQLCDPSPKGETKLDSRLLKDISPDKIPQNVYKFMIIDPAGDSKDGKGDAWAMLVCGVEPTADEVGTSNVFITGAIISPLGESEAIEEAVRLYVAGGIILKVGVEKVGLSTVEIHLANSLKARGRNVSIDSGSLVILRPGGRKKKDRIERALSWPLNNGKLHVSTSVPTTVRDRLRAEMDKFPYWHDDGLDAFSYLYDVIKDYNFIRRQPSQEEKESKRIRSHTEHGWLRA